MRKQLQMCSTDLGSISMIVYNLSSSETQALKGTQQLHQPIAIQHAGIEQKSSMQECKVIPVP